MPRTKLNNTLRIEHIRNGEVIELWQRTVEVELIDEGVPHYIIAFPEAITCKDGDEVRLTGNIGLPNDLIIKLGEN